MTQYEVKQPVWIHANGAYRPGSVVRVYPERIRVQYEYRDEQRQIEVNPDELINWFKKGVTDTRVMPYTEDRPKGTDDYAQAAPEKMNAIQREVARRQAQKAAETSTQQHTEEDNTMPALTKSSDLVKGSKTKLMPQAKSTGKAAPAKADAKAKPAAAKKAAVKKSLAEVNEAGIRLGTITATTYDCFKKGGMTAEDVAKVVSKKHGKEYPTNGVLATVKFFNELRGTKIPTAVSDKGIISLKKGK